MRLKPWQGLLLGLALMYGMWFALLYSIGDAMCGPDGCSDKSGVVWNTLKASVLYPLWGSP